MSLFTPFFLSGLLLLCSTASERQVKLGNGRPPLHACLFHLRVVFVDGLRIGLGFEIDGFGIGSPPFLVGDLIFGLTLGTLVFSRPKVISFLRLMPQVTYEELQPFTLYFIILFQFLCKLQGNFVLTPKDFAVALLLALFGGVPIIEMQVGVGAIREGLR